MSLKLLELIVLFLYINLTQCEKPKNSTVDTDSGRIVGGEVAQLEDFPFMVHFYNKGGMCAGSILTKSTVLTAAHCFQFNKDPIDMQVFSGARVVYDKFAISHDVITFITHQYYDMPAKFSNDIAIILIADEFNYGPIVQKAKLINNNEWMNGENVHVTVAGWGNTREDEQAGTNTKLYKTKLKLLNRKVCDSTNHLKLGQDMICLFGDQKQDACQGDSGAAVLYKSLVVGLVSHGIGCAEKPSMYTNVYYFRPWIHVTVKQLQRTYCQYKNL